MQGMAGPCGNRAGAFATRLLVALMLAVAFAGTLATTAPHEAAAGQAGYINTQGVPLMAGYTDDSVILWMDEGVRVDLLWGPDNGRYEIYYYDVHGWVSAEYITPEGAGGATSAPVMSNAPAATAEAEHWIDVDRSNGSVTLFVGDVPQATYWGSLGWDPSDNGYYSTAVGTYYVTWMDASLTYTPFADNYITHWVGFDWERANGFHSYTKDANGNLVPGGNGPTGGCVALNEAAAQAVYNFAFPGMRVEIHN